MFISGRSTYNGDRSSYNGMKDALANVSFTTLQESARPPPHLKTICAKITENYASSRLSAPNSTKQVYRRPLRCEVRGISNCAQKTSDE